MGACGGVLAISLVFYVIACRCIVSFHLVKQSYLNMFSLGDTGALLKPLVLEMESSQLNIYGILMHAKRLTNHSLARLDENGIT